MSSFELPRTDSSQPTELEPGPLPITAELLGDLFHHIEEQWYEYDKHKHEHPRDFEACDKIKSELCHAYDELIASKEQIAQLDLPAALKQKAQDELWFACKHLDSMLKYYT